MNAVLQQRLENWCLSFIVTNLRTKHIGTGNDLLCQSARTRSFAFLIVLHSIHGGGRTTRNVVRVGTPFLHLTYPHGLNGAFLSLDKSLQLTLFLSISFFFVYLLFSFKKSRARRIRAFQTHVSESFPNTATPYPVYAFNISVSWPEWEEFTDRKTKNLKTTGMSWKCSRENIRPLFNWINFLASHERH